MPLTIRRDDFRGEIKVLRDGEIYLIEIDTEK